MRSMLNRQAVIYGLLFSAAAVPAWGQVNRVRPPATAQPVEPGRDVRRASCVLQLEFDGERGNRSFDVQTLNALLTSTTLVDPAAEKALNLSPDRWPSVVQLEVVPAGNSAVRFGITISQDSEPRLAPNAAQLLMDELTARAKTIVDSAGTRQATAREKRLIALEAELADVLEELKKVSAKLREGQATEQNRAIGFQNAGRMDRESLEINLQAQRARLIVLEAEKQRLSATATTRPATEAPSPWADLIAAREKIVAIAREQKEAGRLDALALLQAEASLAEVRAMSALGRGDRREIDPAERWQAEIVSLKASIAESEARLAAMKEHAPKQVDPPVDVEGLRQEEGSLRNKASDLRNQVENLKREQRNAGMSTTLNILDGKVRE